MELTSVKTAELIVLEKTSQYQLCECTGCNSIDLYHWSDERRCKLCTSPKVFECLTAQVSKEVRPDLYIYTQPKTRRLSWRVNRNEGVLKYDFELKKTLNWWGSSSETFSLIETLGYWQKAIDNPNYKPKGQKAKEEIHRNVNKLYEAMKSNTPIIYAKAFYSVRNDTTFQEFRKKLGKQLTEEFQIIESVQHRSEAYKHRVFMENFYMKSPYHRFL